MANLKKKNLRTHIVPTVTAPATSALIDDVPDARCGMSFKWGSVYNLDDLIANLSNLRHQARSSFPDCVPAIYLEEAIEDLWTVIALETEGEAEYQERLAIEQEIAKLNAEHRKKIRQLKSKL